VGLGTYGFADAYLPRTLGDGNKHDVHHSHTTDKKCDTRHEQSHQENHTHHVVESAHERVELVDREVVILCGAQFTNLAHFPDHLELQLLQCFS